MANGLFPQIQDADQRLCRNICFSDRKAMLTVKETVINEEKVIFKNRNNVIYPFAHAASRNMWYQACMVRYCNVHLKGSQTLRDGVAPVHGVIIVWVGILWIMCVCLCVSVCVCVLVGRRGSSGRHESLMSFFWVHKHTKTDTPYCITAWRRTHAWFH